MTSLESNDTSQIIIFEDVLFYGAFYNGSAFKDMIITFVKLTENRKIIIAYYDNTRERRKDKMFHEVIQESWIRQEDLSRLEQERINIMQDSLLLIGLQGNRIFVTADSIACEKYFAIYRDDELKEFSERKETILVPFYDGAKNDYPLFLKLDDLKNICFGKPEKEIIFSDIYTMYFWFTEELKLFFYNNKIKTIPLNSYLSMSCWSNGEKVLFAFPGRFAADEIGFISHDEHILNYIETMLKGTLSHSKDMSKNH